MKNVKSILAIALICFTTVWSSVVFSGECNAVRYNGNNSVEFVRYGLFLYYKDKSMQMNKTISSDDACLLATNIAEQVDTVLQNGDSTLLYADVNYVYESLFAGVYYKGLLATITSGAIGGLSGLSLSPNNPNKYYANANVKLLQNVVKFNNGKNIDKYNFQMYVVAPYRYNVTNDRDEVNNTQRYGSKGSIVKPCGKLVCQSEKASIFDFLLY